jgi:hypothetical protein
MKKVYKDLFGEICKKRFTEKLTGFVVSKTSASKMREAGIPVGSVLFESNLNNVSFYILVMPHRTQDEIQVDAGWSEENKFPYYLAQSMEFDLNDQKVQCREYMASFSIYHRNKVEAGFINWELMKSSVEIPFVDASKKSDPAYLASFNAEVKKCMAEMVAEDMLPVSQDQARNRICNAVDRCIADVVKYVIPIFFSKNE